MSHDSWDELVLRFIGDYTRGGSRRSAGAMWRKKQIPSKGMREKKGDLGKNVPLRSSPPSTGILPTPREINLSSVPVIRFP